MIRAGIVGVGRWGQILVRSVYRKSNRIEFVRGVTRTPANATAFTEETGIPINTSYDALLADPNIDAVVLATPHSQHIPQVEQAAAAGKHVFVEKPIATDAVSAERAYLCCREAGVALALGHNRRYLPAYRELFTLVESGTLGQLLHVEGNFSGPSAYRQRRDGWRADRAESPAGGMTGMGIHITDLMVDLLGPVHDVTAISSRQVGDFGMDDTTAVLMRFSSGQTGALATLTATPDDWRFQIFGSRGWAEIRAEKKLTVGLLDQPRTVTEFGTLDIERAVLEGFAAMIEDGADFPVTAQQAVANTALLEAIARSSEESATVAVNLPSSGGVRGK